MKSEEDAFQIETSLGDGLIKYLSYSIRLAKEREQASKVCLMSWVCFVM